MKRPNTAASSPKMHLEIDKNRLLAVIVMDASIAGKTDGIIFKMRGSSSDKYKSLLLVKELTTGLKTETL
jgi:hypothetical protein